MPGYITGINRTHLRHDRLEVFAIRALHDMGCNVGGNILLSVFGLFLEDRHREGCCKCRKGEKFNFKGGGDLSVGMGMREARGSV